MTVPFLPYGRQAIDDDDIAAVAAVMRSDFLTTGPVVDDFEAALSERLGGVNVIACSSGTAALHLTTLALGLGPGDFAIVPAITFLATANAVRYTGADVIFCDVDPLTGLMTADTFAAALAQNKDKRIRVALPVHLAGQPADPVGIGTIAARERVAVIEDACHALGTLYTSADGKRSIPVGACGDADMATFSFHPVKTIACGEGGAITTESSELAQKLRQFRSHGMTRTAEDFQDSDMGLSEAGTANPWYYEMPEPGFNYRLSDINAALGLSQIGKLDQFIDKRRYLVDLYDQHIANLGPNIQALGRVPNCNIGWHLYPVLIDFAAAGTTRARLMEDLRAKGIGTQVHYIPVSSQPYYRGLYGKQVFAGAEAYYARTLSLPLFSAMIEDDVARVADALGSCLIS